MEQKRKDIQDYAEEKATERLNTAQFGFAVKKGANQELLQKFNDGLKKLKESGKYQEILEKYTGKAEK